MAKRVLDYCISWEFGQKRDQKHVEHVRIRYPGCQDLNVFD